jgi:hypothetical protein
MGRNLRQVLWLWDFVLGREEDTGLGGDGCVFLTTVQPSTETSLTLSKFGRRKVGFFFCEKVRRIWRERIMEGFGWE